MQVFHFQKEYTKSKMLKYKAHRKPVQVFKDMGLHHWGSK